MTFYNITTSTLRLICKLFFKIHVIGAENIPNEGKIIIAANHKSNWDPIFLAASIKNRNLIGIAKKELDNSLTRWFINKLGVITIDRENPDITSVKKVLKALKNDEAVVIFPEGTRVKGESFGEPKPGLSLFALKSKANIIPVSIISNYKLFNHVIIYIDKPISLEEHHNKKLTKEEQQNIAQSVMDKIKENHNVITYFGY